MSRCGASRDPRHLVDFLSSARGPPEWHRAAVPLDETDPWFTRAEAWPCPHGVGLSWVIYSVSARAPEFSVDTLFIGSFRSGFNQDRV